MSNVDSCINLVLIPKDPTKPVIGGFKLANGDSQRLHEEYAATLGLKPGEYEWREVVSTKEAEALYTMNAG